MVIIVLKMGNQVVQTTINWSVVRPGRFVGDAWKQPALCPPIKLEVVWQAKYFTGLVWIHNVSTVLPIAPEGYRCLGLIAIPRSEDHLANVLLAQYRCVREDLVVPTGVYTDRG